MLAGSASTSTSVRISASMPSIVLLGLWKAIGTIARDRHPQVRREEVDMKRLAANRILLHLANEHRLVAVLPAENEES